MVINSLHLRRYRSYIDASFDFHDGVNVVIGQNGVGKTNLLEAIFFMMRGSSFRVADKDLPLHGSEWFRIDAGFDDHDRTARYQTTRVPAKRFSINEGAEKRFTRALSLPVVLFEPDMLRVLGGSPARRRRLLDELIIQWFDDGASLLRKYDRVLLQRNNVLKNAYNMSSAQVEDNLFAWDVSFAELSDKIEEHRRSAVATLNLSMTRVYGEIANKPHVATVSYDGVKETGKQHIIHSLKARRRLDISRGYTTLGPHRSDFNIELNGKPANITASRGEQRSLMLAIKYIEASELSRIYSTAPILLFDDVMSELDSDRQKALIKDIGDSQTIVTTTNVAAWSAKKAKIIDLSKTVSKKN